MGLATLRSSKRRVPLKLTIDDFVFHPMQLAYDLVQDFLRDNTMLRVQPVEKDSMKMLGKECKRTCFILSNSVSDSLVLPTGLTLQAEISTG